MANACQACKRTYPDDLGACPYCGPSGHRPAAAAAGETTAVPPGPGGGPPGESGVVELGEPSASAIDLGGATPTQAARAEDLAREVGGPPSDVRPASSPSFILGEESGTRRASGPP